VKIYKNGLLIGQASVTAWPYYASGGKIGLWNAAAAGVALDDFLGGSN
jgi:hypothetical protein